MFFQIKWCGINDGAYIHFRLELTKLCVLKLRGYPCAGRPPRHMHHVQKPKRLCIVIWPSVKSVDECTERGDPQNHLKLIVPDGYRAQTSSVGGSRPVCANDLQP